MEHGTLIVPGIQFGREGYFRLAYGYSEAHLRGGLAELSTLLQELTETRAASST